MIRKEFIKSELQYRYPEVAGEIRYPAYAVGRPLFWESGMRKLGGRVVVCTASQLEAFAGRDQSEPLFVCMGTPNSEVLDRVDVCVLPQSESPSVVMNVIQRLFDRLDDWTSLLRQTADESENIQALLEQAYGMLQNPITLMDGRGHVVARTPQTSEIKSQVRDQNEDVLTALIENAEASFTLVCTAQERAFYGSDEVVFESLADNIRRMFAEHRLFSGDIRKNSANDIIEKHLRRLIAGDTRDEETIEALTRSDWPEEADYCVLAVEPRDGDLRTPAVHRLRDILETRLSNCCAFITLPVITVVMRLNGWNASAQRSALETLAEELGLRIGVCESVEGFQHVPERLAMAALALNHAGDAEPVVFFGDIAEDYFARRAVGEFPAELIAMRSVRDVARYDREHGTNYLETAQRYIANRFNAVQTANDLFIHRSTFLYRLDRLKTQFGLDLEGDTIPLTHLLLSIWLMKEMDGAGQKKTARERFS